MDRILNAHEALKILRKHYITEEIQMVSRFIRNGRLIGERDTRKDGWRIKEVDLYDFIDNEKPGIVEVMHVYDQYLNNLSVNSSAEEYLKFKSELHQGKVTELLKNLLPSLKIVSEKENVQTVTTDNSSVDDLKEAICDIKDFIKSISQKGLPLDATAVDKIAVALSSQFPLKRGNVEGEDGRKRNDKRKNNGKYDQMSILEFEEMLKSLEIEALNEMDNPMNIREKIYHVYFEENGKLKSNIYHKESNKFNCPETKEKNQQFKYLLKRTVPQLITTFKSSFSKTSNPSTQPIISTQTSDVKPTDTGDASIVNIEGNSQTNQSSREPQQSMEEKESIKEGIDGISVLSQEGEQPQMDQSSKDTQQPSGKETLPTDVRFEMGEELVED
ncbi:hypothetical protein [Bacillus sp. 1P06AnD]|uniref:hypothetical protein n=1 Tax=Bacillus sp. 1P06AnD TaxID=3132208 RepID=UPI0039A3CC40